METDNLLDSSSSHARGYGSGKEQAGDSDNLSGAAAIGPVSEAVTIAPSRMCRPLSACQVFVVMLAALMMTLAVAMLAGGYQAMMNRALQQQLVIKEGSKAYNMWKETPMPLSLRLYVFNLTNPEEVKLGLSPVVEELGPYVWREYHEKQNVSFHPNKTVTYLQQRWWVWDQEASGECSQDDTILTLNTIPVAAAYRLRNSYSIYALNLAFRNVGEQLFVYTTAREVLFDGVEDPLLDWIQTNVVSPKGKYHWLLPFFEVESGGLTKFEKFAWFYKRNLSLTYDGEFNMMTGEDTLDNLGRIDNWNGRNSTPFYDAPCNQLNGSAGELFPPHLKKTDLTFFSSDLCMSAKLFFKETRNDCGLESYRYWGTNHTFANGSTVPGNECFCVGDTCAPMGLLNAESCRMGAPAFVSFPHFYAGDPQLVMGVYGLQPDAKKHAFYMDLLPDLGIPTNVSVKLQINLHLEPISGITMLKEVPDVYLPMLWFEVRAEMPPAMADQIKMLSFFLYSPMANVGVWVGVLSLAVLMLLGVGLYNCYSRNGEYERLQDS